MSDVPRRHIATFSLLFSSRLWTRPVGSSFDRKIPSESIFIYLFIMSDEVIGTVEEAEECVCWTLPGFADLRRRYYLSPVSSLGAVGGGVEWRMWIYPNGVMPEYEGHVSVVLWRVFGSGAVPRSSLRYNVSLLRDGHLTHTSPPTPGDKRLYKFIKRTELLNDPGLLPNGQLKVHMKVWPADTAEPSCHHAIEQMPNDPHSITFKSWYQNEDYTDLTVKVHDKKYRVHKFVLASRSRVFYTMLLQGMSESNTNSVDVTDMTSEEFVHFLEYMYTLNVTDLNNFDAELLNAAEKYELDDLKAMCVASLHKSISADTVLDTLILADLYRAPNLKTAALEFIKRQGQAVTSSEGWVSFLTEHPKLATEVVRYLLPTKTT